MFLTILSVRGVGGFNRRTEANGPGSRSPTPTCIRVRCNFSDNAGFLVERPRKIASCSIANSRPAFTFHLDELPFNHCRLDRLVRALLAARVPGPFALPAALVAFDSVSNRR